MPGEAQKIERLMQIFSTRYCQSNREFLATLHSTDTVFILAFAIILLNTDLHTPNIKVIVINYGKCYKKKIKKSSPKRQKYDLMPKVYPTTYVTQ